MLAAGAERSRWERGLGCGRSAPLAVTRREVVAVEQAAHALVVGEVGGPALLVVRQPEGIALGAMSDEGDLLGAHSGEV
jgi:hypothetical protein